MQLRGLYGVWKDNRLGNQADVVLNLLKHGVITTHSAVGKTREAGSILASGI